MKDVRLRVSKFASYLLRHNPQIGGLTLDGEGFTPLEDLVKVLREKFPHLKENFLKEILESSKRFQIEEGKVRAFYGHSLKIEIRYPPLRITGRLYHGTSPQAAEFILKEGLRPMGRNKCHLSFTREEAYLVGRRKAKHPVILVIDVERATRAGIKFYQAGPVALADYILAQFICRL